MFALGMLVTAAYWPGISGAATSPRWLVLAVVPWLLREQRMTAAHWIGAAFIAWSALTITWSGSPLDGGKAMFILLVLAACFCLGSQLSNLRPLWAGAAIGMTVSSGFAVAQWLGYAPVPTIFTPIGGLFLNGNYMAEAAALVIVALVAERMWWLIPGVLPALLLTDARGAMIAAGVALALHWRRWWLITVPFVGFVALTVALITLQRHGPGQDLTERWLIWQSALDGVTAFGHGAGSFLTAFPYYDLRPGGGSLPEYAHNEFLNVAFEIGIVGLALAGAFCLSLAGPLDTPRLVLIALFVESCFAFPLHLPVTGFLGFVAAGNAVRRGALLRRVAVRRRVDVSIRSAMA